MEEDGSSSSNEKGKRKGRATDLTPELEQRLQNLWRSTDFEANHSGSVVFTNALASLEHIHLPYKTVLRILRKIPEFNQFARRRYKFKRRHYNISSVGSLWQIGKCMLTNSTYVLLNHTLLCRLNVHRCL